MSIPFYPMSMQWSLVMRAFLLLALLIPLVVVVVTGSRNTSWLEVPQDDCMDDDPFNEHPLSSTTFPPFGMESQSDMASLMVPLKEDTLKDFGGEIKDYERGERGEESNCEKKQNESQNAQKKATLGHQANNCHLSQSNAPYIRPLLKEASQSSNQISIAPKGIVNNRAFFHDLRLQGKLPIIPLKQSLPRYSSCIRLIVHAPMLKSLEPSTLIPKDSQRLYIYWQVLGIYEAFSNKVDFNTIFGKLCPERFLDLFLKDEGPNGRLVNHAKKFNFEIIFDPTNGSYITRPIRRDLAAAKPRTTYFSCNDLIAHRFWVNQVDRSELQLEDCSRLDRYLELLSIYDRFEDKIVFKELFGKVNPSSTWLLFVEGREDGAQLKSRINKSGVEIIYDITNNLYRIRRKADEGATRSQNEKADRLPRRETEMYPRGPCHSTRNLERLDGRPSCSDGPTSCFKMDIKFLLADQENLMQTDTTHEYQEAIARDKGTDVSSSIGHSSAEQPDQTLTGKDLQFEALITELFDQDEIDSW